MDGNLTYLAKYLQENLPKARFCIPEGTYLAWIDLSGYGWTEDELRDRISKAGLYLEYASEFIDDPNGFVRMNTACPRSTMERACQMLKAAMEG